MPSAFDTKKAKILSQLSSPSDTYTDLSPKGSVDAPIRTLVDQINAIPTLATTSSCSGRIAIYSSGSTQAKGGGSWLFVSHTPLTLDSSTTLPALLESDANEFPRSVSIFSHVGDASFDPAAPLVHLKFEPLILHVMCASTSAARKLLAAAQGAGFRESGIASLPPAAVEGDRKRRAQQEGPVMLAIRTMGLGMDAPIAVSEGEGIRMVVGEGYVASLLAVANARFEVNEKRKQRLVEGIRDAFREESTTI